MKTVISNFGSTRTYFKMSTVWYRTWPYGHRTPRESGPGYVWRCFYVSIARSAPNSGRTCRERSIWILWNGLNLVRPQDLKLEWVPVNPKLEIMVFKFTLFGCIFRPLLSQQLFRPLLSFIILAVTLLSLLILAITGGDTRIGSILAQNDTFKGQGRYCGNNLVTVL